VASGVALDGLETTQLLDDPMSVALPLEHPLAGRARVRLADLSAERWIQCDPNGHCGAVQVAACEQSGFKPHVTFQTNDYNVAQGLVAAGVAISLVPELALSNVREDIVIRPLAGRDMPVRRVVAATRGGGFRSPATTAMVEILEQAAAEYVERRDQSLALRSAS
jgi:DNA-binding transcriptional LysR family regulator